MTIQLLKRQPASHLCKTWPPEIANIKKRYNDEMCESLVHITLRMLRHGDLFVKCVVPRAAQLSQIHICKKLRCSCLDSLAHLWTTKSSREDGRCLSTQSIALVRCVTYTTRASG